MAMGKRSVEEQGALWIRVADLPTTGGHPFYEQVNKILATEGFDRFVEDRYRGFYADQVGRPSLAPAVYFRMLLIGYCDGIDRERGIVWRVSDSMGLRRFLGYALTDSTADHSTLTSMEQTIQEADNNLVTVMKNETAAEQIHEQVLTEIVADKGYHSNAVLTRQCEREIRPKRRNTETQKPILFLLSAFCVSAFHATSPDSGGSRKVIAASSRGIGGAEFRTLL